MDEMEQRNIMTGILGTVAFHLVILAAFLIFKLDEVKTKHKEQLVIELSNLEFKPIEQIIDEAKPEPLVPEPLSSDDYKNIAVNKAEQFDQQVSTEKYIENLKQELGIEDPPPVADQPGDVSMVDKEQTDENPGEPEVFKGKTRISYYLENRHHQHLERPIYLCEGGGKVVLDIIVNQEGAVVSTSVQSTDTDDPCIIEMAVDAARKSYFNTSYEAPGRQKGTITYIFVAQ